MKNVNLLSAATERGKQSNLSETLDFPNVCFSQTLAFILKSLLVVLSLHFARLVCTRSFSRDSIQCWLGLKCICGDGDKMTRTHGDMVESRDRTLNGIEHEVTFILTVNDLVDRKPVGALFGISFITIML